MQDDTREMTSPSPAEPLRAAAATVRRLEPGEVEEFVRSVLFDPERALPVVALTTHRGREEPPIDPGELAEALGERATVVLLATGEATWALSEALPDMLDVYGGAARIWWPGLSADSSYRDHPLLFVWGPADVPRVFARIVKQVTGSSPRTSSLPDPWERVAGECAVGDAVMARVERVTDRYVLVALLPGARAIVPMAEVDWAYVKHPAEVVEVGEFVPVKILELDPGGRRCTVSIKQGRVGAPPASLPLLPGGVSFQEAVGGADARGQERPAPRGKADAAVEQVLRARIEELEGELAAVQEDRRALIDRQREAKKQLADQRRQLRVLQARAEALEAAVEGEDPLASETSFLRAVRVAYARAMGEDDRLRYPLQRMRVGREFLQRARGLHGVAATKIVDVCMQVACLRAHEIPSREVHRLRAGPAGAPDRSRRADGAPAWRCSLQDNSPAARRLHWWDVPGEDGRTIEFASVAVHDDLSIPE